MSATAAIIADELEGHRALARVLGGVVPSEWPPEYHDRETLEFWRERLLEPGAAGWWLHHAVLAEPEAPTLVGSVGYKGPPADGASRSATQSCRRGGAVALPPRPAGP